MKRLRRSQTGQSIVEMALVTPLLMLLLLGVVDVGRAMAVKIAVTNASREAARYGSWYPQDYTGIADTVDTELALNNLNASDAVVEISPSSAESPASSGDPIEVTVTMDMQTTFGTLVGMDTIRVTGSTEMVVFGTED